MIRFNALKIIISGPLLVALLLTASGCGIYKSRKSEYQQTGSIKPITLPSEDMADAPLEPLFAIPQIEEQDDSFRLKGSEDSLRPEAMSQDSQASLVKIQKVGERKWIILDAPTGQVWPLVQSFLLSNDMGVINAKPAEGVIETDWLMFKSDDATYHRFRLRIEKGVRDETTEVHVLQDQEVASGQLHEREWPKASVSIEKERWFTDSLSNVLAADITNRAASLLGQAVGGEDKVKVAYINSEPTLRIKLDRTRAMASLSRSTSKEGFISWEDLASDGLFYVAFNDPNNKKPWWKIGGEETLGDKAPYELSVILAHLADSAAVKSIFGDIEGYANGAKLDGAKGLLLKLVEDGPYQYLRVRNTRGERLEPDYTKQLLMIIKRNMI